MSGKEKLLYLIAQYKNGNYSTDDFCTQYTNTIIHDMDDSDFAKEELEQFEKLMSGSDSALQTK